MTIDFDVEQDAVTDATVALYMDPYILTANYSKTFDEQGKESNSHVYNIYGPATCGMMLTIDSQEGETDPEGNPLFESLVALTVDDMRVEGVVNNRDAMLDEITMRRKTVPTALSAPNTNSYVTSVKLYHTDATMHNPEGHIANIFAGNDTWLIQFTDNIYSNYNLFTAYIDPIIALYPLEYQIWQELIQSFTKGGEAMPVDITGCTDAFADNYNFKATIDDGSCSYVDQTPEPGTGDQTPEPETGTGDQGGSGYQEIP